MHALEEGGLIGGLPVHFEEIQHHPALCGVGVVAIEAVVAEELKRCAGEFFHRAGAEEAGQKRGHGSNPDSHALDQQVVEVSGRGGEALALHAELVHQR